MLCHEELSQSGTPYAFSSCCHHCIHTPCLSLWAGGCFKSTPFALYSFSGESPITCEHYFPSFSLCCNTLLERQSLPHLSSHGPCILCSSSPTHSHLTVPMACCMLSQAKGRHFSLPHHFPVLMTHPCCDFLKKQVNNIN